MKHVRCIVCAMVYGTAVSSAVAATSAWSVDSANTIPGTVANALFADGQGDPWFGAVLKIDLTSGSVLNEPIFGVNGGTGDITQGNLWTFVPELQWDSAVGVFNDGTTHVAGGSGDLGGGPRNLGGTGIDAASISWISTASLHSTTVQVANITLSDDASGSWQLYLTFTGRRDTVSVFSSGNVIGGVVPEPATLGLMGLAGLTIMCRRREAFIYDHTNRV